MSAFFNETGNLILMVNEGTVPDSMPKTMLGLLDVSNRQRELNLTAYIRSLTKTDQEQERLLGAEAIVELKKAPGVTYTSHMLPAWASAALTSTSTNLTVEQKDLG